MSSANSNIPVQVPLPKSLAQYASAEHGGGRDGDSGRAGGNLLSSILSFNSRSSSGGALEATPHCVVASESREVSRCTFALFMQPRWSTVLDKSGLTFGEFSGRRLEEAYS
jgi:hypothetical protein